MDQFWASVFYAVLGISLLAGAWAWLLLFIRKGAPALLGYEKVVLNQFENAAVYKDGQFERILEPGVHWVQSRNRRLTVVDVRPEVYRIDQTCVTSDHFTAAIRYIARVRIRDPRAAISISQNHKEEVAARLQSVVKKLGEQQTIRAFCTTHDNLNAIAQDLATTAIADAGYECTGFEILQVQPLGAVGEFSDKRIGFTIQ